MTMTVIEICTLCNGARATTMAPFPVCQSCAEGLADLQAELDEMEANDPELKKSGDACRDLEAHLRGELSTFGIRQRSLARMRAARQEWKKT